MVLTSKLKQITILTLKQTKIATIRQQLIEKGKVRSTGKASSPFELLPGAEMIADRLNAILAIASGHEELVESVINDWLNKHSEIGNHAREIEG